MTLDPKTKFIIGLFITLAIGISSGAVQLTHAIPEGWISGVTAWAGIIAFLGSAFQTTLQGFGITAQSRINAAAAVPEVSQIVTSKAIADATPSDKVVGPK